MLPPLPRSASRIERYDTIVVGAGQAGLAVGYHLQRRDADFLILDGAPRIGESWRRRWDSLRVFTSAAFTALPGLPFPARSSHLPDKDELADYLERYAQHFDLPVRLNTRVNALTRIAGWYRIETDDITYEARNVVVATGPFHTPSVPSISASLSPEIRQLHSSEYRNPFALPEGRVLVVGAGNAGGRIALEVSRFRPVTLAGARMRNFPNRLLGRDIHWWLWPLVTRLSSTNWAGRLLRDRVRHDPVVGVSEGDFARAGIERLGRVTGVEHGAPIADGKALDVQAVIWATGFAPDFGWIRFAFPIDGREPRTERGVIPEAPGLYFVGLRFQHTMASALIGGVGHDAAFVARHITRGEAA